MKTSRHDVLIIGSGFGAAAPAYHLSRAGFKVAMVEKGPRISIRKDLKQTQDPQYFSQYLKSLKGDHVNFTYAEGYGGGSTFYEMVSLRAPSEIFDQKDAAGRNVWPSALSRKALEPYYERAEKMLNVHQIEKSRIPKTGVAFAQLMKNLGYSCDRARYAVKRCVGSGYCVSGCIFNAKQSLQLNYLKAAESAGMQVFADQEVIRIESTDKNYLGTNHRGAVDQLPYAFRVKTKDKNTGDLSIYEAKLVILGAGTVGTAKILLNSASRLPRLSREVGKNIAYNGSIKVLGLLPPDVVRGDMFTGMSHPGMISYHFLKSRGITISCAKPLPLVLTSAAKISLSSGKNFTRQWGDEHVDLMKRCRHEMIVLYALGLAHGSAEITKTGKDRFKVHLNIDDHIRKYYADTKSLLESILVDNGGQIIHAEMIDREGNLFKDIYFGTTHMVGSCRMASDPNMGVTDINGEVFGYPGMFITDGSALCGSLAVNTSLTILANSERITNHLIDRYKVF